MIQDTVLVNIIKDIVSSMKVLDPEKTDGSFLVINYNPGRAYHILKSIQESDNSISLKEKYPMIAMVMPIQENFGSGFVKITIPRIVIAVHTQDSEGDILPRYETGGNYIKLLYPLYREFLKRVALSKYTSGQDPDAIIHKKMDNPGQQPIGEGTNDYIDSIEILNLELILNQIKTC